MPAIALATCVRDEEDVLGDWLVHHRRLGVEQAYVYLDRCTDRSAEVVAADPGAEAISFDAAPELRWLTLHQNRAMADALARSRAAGFDWLLFLDVDEYAWSGPAEAPRPDPDDGLLHRLVEGLDPEVEVVRLLPLEAVPEREHVDQPPWAFPHVQHPGVLVRDVLDPGDGRRRPVDRLLGHPRGKAVVRTDAQLVPVDVHEWAHEDGGPAVEVVRGWHLHVLTTGPAQWQAKFAKLAFQPDHWPAGNPVAFPTQAWKEAATSMDADEARRYWLDWVAVGPDVVAAAVADGTLSTNRAVAATLGHLPPMAPPPDPAGSQP